MTEKFIPGAEFRPGWHACPECGDEYYRDFHWKALCLDCYLERKETRKALPAQQTAQQVIPPDMLRRLLQCCHPDKHGGSEAATIATRYLLELRGQHG